jgi:hypothetical protein
MRMLLKEMSPLVISILLTSFNSWPGAPRLRFDHELYNFGRIPRGKPVKTVFHFFNVGDGPLVIYSVEAACGCTTTSFNHEAIGRGHSGTIVVSFDASSLHQFEKQIVVRSNSSTPVKVLYIRGEVVAP